MKTIAMKRTNITTKTLLFLLLALAGTAKAQNTHLSVVKDSIEYNTLYVIQVTQSGII